MHDFAIIGTGAAGFQLALALAEDRFFDQKSIVLIEPEAKTANDRTFCFWEKGPGRWDDFLENEWQNGRFFEQNGREIRLDMGRYRYKMLRSAAFYAEARRRLEAAANVVFERDECLEAIEKPDSVELVCRKKTLAARLVFDSRMPAAFFEKESDSVRLVQHFKGWIVRAATEKFDPRDLVLMDYRAPYPADSTSFFYVLPLAADRALVEFTLFNDQLLNENEYDAQLKKYVERLVGPDFEIEETEAGTIPMTDFEFEKGHTRRIKKIGTAGGWVKPSSGYSFKNCERNALRLVENLKKRGFEQAEKGIADGRWRFYDALILDILKRENARGPAIFGQLFRRNRAAQVFSFLDETTSIFEEIRLTASLDWPPFLAALGRRLLKKRPQK